MAHYHIKSRWDESKILYEGEAETLRDLVNTAVAKRVGLRGAYLRGADLRGAYLGGAYLGGAYHVFSFAGIGSARRNTTYWLEADKVWCGCFEGTLEEFRAQVEETHEENPKFLAEYRAGILFLEACIKLIPEDEREAGQKAYAAMIAKTEAEFEAERKARAGVVNG